MIRVNLLPHAAERKTVDPESQSWVLVVVLLVVVEIIVLFFFHGTKQDELAAVQAEVAELVSQINDKQAKVKDHEKIKEQLDGLRQREDAIAKLQSGRKGPTAVLLELSRVLTKGKGPTVSEKKLQQQRRDDPTESYNRAWDPKRLWLLEYAETERNVRLQGVARDGSDVYEFAQRLKLSQYFDEVTLLPGKQTDKSSKTLELVTFALQVKVKY